MNLSNEFSVLFHQQSEFTKVYHIMATHNNLHISSVVG